MVSIDELLKLGQIILVDLVLAGDNAILIGLVAAKFTAAHRRKVILYGVGVAVLLRIAFAILTVELLAIKGLLLVGGLLLLWVCWKLWGDLRIPVPDKNTQSQDDGIETSTKNPTMAVSIMQITIADLSMSIDNVIAVAGIADGHTVLLIIGLAIAVVFMTVASGLIANVLQKHRWIGYIGLATIVYVGLRMTYEGSLQLLF